MQLYKPCPLHPMNSAAMNTIITTDKMLNNIAYCFSCQIVAILQASYVIYPH